MFEIKNNKVDLSINIMREVASWGRSKGLRVWLDEWLTKDLLVTEEADENAFCVGYSDGIPSCTMILQWEDKKWWPRSKKYEAAYIHKLCVRRDFAGQGLPQLCLDYAIEACKKHQAKFIRLDTGWDEETMKELYLSLGFKIVEKVTLDNQRCMALYEYRIT